jgi:hypothetical protein
VRKITPIIPVDQQESTEIILGEDNCSALAALTSLYYPTDPLVCRYRMQLYVELGGISLTFIWLLTRGKPVNLEECRWAYNFCLRNTPRWQCRDVRCLLVYIELVEVFSHPRSGFIH